VVKNLDWDSAYSRDAVYLHRLRAVGIECDCHGLAASMSFRLQRPACVIGVCVVYYVDTHMGALSYTGLFVLQALAQGYRFGFDIMDVTRLPSGTVYPALRRLETLGMVRSDWETDKEARANARPRRRYYELTKAGRAQLVEAESRYRAVAKLFTSRGRV
jgi:PadR family transcriptional regulator PadR